MASKTEKRKAAAANNGSTRTLLQNIMFGGTAGAVGQASIFPMYTAKTNLQSFSNRYSGLINCLRVIAQRDGMCAICTGMRPALTFTFPEKAIKLAMNDLSTRKAR